jgi:hypothetical protein
MEKEIEQLENQLNGSFEDMEIIDNFISNNETYILNGGELEHIIKSTCSHYENNNFTLDNCYNCKYTALCLISKSKQFDK